MHKISIASGRSYQAITYTIDDEIVKVSVKKYKCDVSTVHLDNLNLVTSTIKKFIALVDRQGYKMNTSEDLIVEIKDKSVMKWIDNLEAPKKYSQPFIYFLNQLDKLIPNVDIIYLTEPSAMRYTDEISFNKYKEHFSNSLADMLLLKDE